MEMDGVRARGQSAQVELEFDAGGKGLDLDCSTSLPLASFTSTVTRFPLAMALADTNRTGNQQDGFAHGVQF